MKAAARKDGRTTTVHFGLRRTGRWAASVVFLSAVGARPAAGEEALLGRSRIVELVRTAPDVRASEAQVGVSRAAVAAAGSVSLENPLLSGLGGVRFNPDGSRHFAGTATLSWPVDTGGKRGTRIEAASAEHRDASAAGEAQRRRMLLALLLQHAAVLRDEQQVAVANSRHANSERVLASARKRREAGSVPPIDVSLATLQEGRDAAAAQIALGELHESAARLAALLGLHESQGIKATGPLVPEGEPPALAAMLQEVGARADVQAASARMRAAEARANRERAAGSPTINLLAQYERDEGANIGTIGVALPLPVLDANTMARATSLAQVRAARAELTATRAAAVGEIRALHARYEATRQARAALAPTTTAAADAIALATRAYELGEGDLASVLLVHRETLEAQRALLDAEHAHAAAKLELLVGAGRIPK